MKYFTYPTDDTDENETRLNMNILKYSETSPYGHLSNRVTSLLRPLFFGRLAETAINFLE